MKEKNREINIAVDCCYAFPFLNAHVIHQYWIHFVQFGKSNEGDLRSYFTDWLESKHKIYDASIL